MCRILAARRLPGKGGSAWAWMVLFRLACADFCH
jgi:hypothetical protein